MLDFLRRNSRSWVVKVVLGVISVVFIFFLGGGGRLQGNSRTVATIGDADVTVDDLQRSMQRNEQFYRQQYGDRLTPELLKLLDIPSMTLTQLVDSAVLRQEAEGLGLRVPDEALRLEIREIPAFQREGQFSPAAYRAVLERQGIGPAAFEYDLRTQLLIEQLVDLIRRGVHVSESEARDEFHRNGDELSLEYVKFSAEEFEPEVTVDEAALQTWYDEHAEQYREPERIRVRYLEYDPKSFADKSAVTEEQIEEYYALHSDLEYTVPETVSARHILKKVAPDADEETKKAARDAIEAAAKRIAAGEDFATVAKEVSDDTSAESGGDLGAFERGRMVPAFEEAAFALPVGQVSEVVESPFGYHLIQVYAKTEGHVKPIEEARDGIVETIANESSDAKAFDAAAEDAREAQDARSLEKVAERRGMKIGTTAPFASGEVVAEVQPAPSFGEAAFALADVDSVSEAVRAGDRYYVIQLQERIDSRVPPLDEVRDAVTAAYRTDRAKEIARERAEALLGKLRSTPADAVHSALEGRELVETPGFTRRGGFLPGLGTIPGLKEVAFQTKADGELLPRVFSEGDAVYVLRRKSWKPANEDDFAGQKEELMADLRREREQAALAEFLRERKASTEISYNQELLAQLTQQ
jgi:peptidyl-prolyl cis-trans isomerase D